jgi:DNA repair protein RadD
MRSYQKRTNNLTKEALRKNLSALVAAPCAAGKTVMFAEVTRWLADAGRRVIILIDRQALVSQTAEALYAQTGIRAGVICASVQRDKDTDAQVIVASRQSLVGVSPFEISLMILDEAHLVDSRKGQYKRIIEAFRGVNPQMRVLGYTATPYRFDGKIHGEGRLFENLTAKVTTSELLEGGHIVPVRFKIKQSDIMAKLDACRKTGGELNGKDQFEVLKRRDYVESCHTVWQDHCEGKKTAIFALNISHAELIHEMFASRGVESLIIHSRMSTDAVNETIDKFKTGNVGIIINVGILTIGSDIPAIERIILARRTISTSLFFQIVGRGGRLCPEIGKSECLVIDLCGSVLIHGADPDNPIIQMRKKSDESPRLQLCPVCEELCGERVRKCPECGFEFPPPPDAEHEEKKKIAEKKACGDIVDFDGKKLIHTVKSDWLVSQLWANPNKPKPTVRLKFSIGAKQVSKWVCPEHDGYPRVAAKKMWKKLGGDDPFPADCREWVGRSSELRKENLIEVSFLGKWPEFIRIAKKGNT